MIKTYALTVITSLISMILVNSSAHAAGPRSGFYVGGSGDSLVSFQINSRAQVDSLSGLATLTCTYSDSSTSSYSLSLSSGAGPIRIRDGVATLRNYRYNQSSDSVVVMNGRITAREVRLAITLTSPESTCRGSLRQRVTRTTAPIVKNYETPATDARGSVAITFTGSKLTTYLVYVLGVCNGITHVITVGDTAEPSDISYSTSGNFTFVKNNPGVLASTSVTLSGIRNSTSDTYTLSVDGSVSNELGTCPFVGTFEASRR